MVLVQQLHAVRADVHPLGVEVARDHRAAGADVRAAVHLVPDGRGELAQVGLAVDVLQRRAALHRGVGKLGRRGLPLRGLPPQRLDQAAMRLLDRQAQDGREPGRARRAAGQHAEALRVALDLVEEQRRRQVLLDVQLADRAELEVPVGAAHVAQLAELLHFGEPGAQIERIAGHRRRL